MILRDYYSNVIVKQAYIRPVFILEYLSLLRSVSIYITLPVLFYVGST